MIERLDSLGLLIACVRPLHIYPKGKDNEPGHSILKDNRVLLCRYSDPINVTQDAATLAQYRYLFDQSTLPIHRIVDSTQVTKVPPDLLTALLHSTNIRHPKSGVIVVIVNQALFRILAEMVKRVVRSADVRVVSTMAEALAEVDSILASEQKKTLPAYA